MQIAVRLGFVHWTVRASVSTTPLLPIARTTGTGWMLGASNNPARRAGTTPSFLTFFVDREPAPAIPSSIYWTHPPPGSAESTSDRQASDPLLESRPCKMVGPEHAAPAPQWRRTPRGHPAPFRCSLQQGYSCARLHVHADEVLCSLRYSSWVVEGMVVTGTFRMAPDPSCSYFTVANIHINSECAKRRSDCIALLLLIRDSCMKLGAFILTGDFDKGAEREAAANGSMDQRRISPLEASFNCANVPWPTSGVWGPGGEPHGSTWPECCGFLFDQAWQFGQWHHLKFVGRTRRRDASPDSKFRQKC